MEKVKLKPILLNDEMVRVILRDGKIVIRRVLKQQPPEEGEYEQMDDGSYQFKVAPYKSIYDYWVKPPYQFGNIFYAKEMWAKISDWVDTDPDVGLSDGFIYKADWENKTEAPKWCSLIYIPKEATRIFLRVTSVRVERLKDITDDQAIDEGCKGIFANVDWVSTPREEYVDVCNGNVKKTDFFKYDWDANPWVWVIEFKRISKEEST